MEVDDRPNEQLNAGENTTMDSKVLKQTKPLCNGKHDDENSLDEGSHDATPNSGKINGSMNKEPECITSEVKNGAESVENKSPGTNKEVSTIDANTSTVLDDKQGQGGKDTAESQAGETPMEDKVSAKDSDSVSQSGAAHDIDTDSAVEITDTPVKSQSSSPKEKSQDDSGKGKSESSVIVVESTSGSASATPRVGTPVFMVRSGTPSGRVSRTGTPVESRSRSGTPTEKQAKLSSAASEVEIPNSSAKEIKKSKVTQILDQASRPVENFRPIAQMLFDIGMDVTRQTVYKDLIKIQRKKQGMGKLDEKETVQLDKLGAAYDELLVKNELYTHDLKTCKHCTFKTDSENVKTCHLEYAHDQHIGLFTCVLCDTTLPSAAQYLFHMDQEHHRRGRVYMKHAFFVCQNCPYESNTHTQFGKHTEKCTKNFNKLQNLIPLAADRDIPLLAPKPIPQKIIVRPAAPKRPVAPPRPVVRPQTPVRPGFAARPIAPSRPGQPSIIGSVAVRPPRAPVVAPPRPVSSYVRPARPSVQSQAAAAASPQATAAIGPGGVPLVQMNGQFYKLTIVGTQQFLVPVSDPGPVQKSPQKTSPIVVQANSKAAADAGIKLKPKVSDHLQALKEGNGRDYEICEICGGFVKDKENLRIHFVWAHKVDIHKDVFKKGRPPLQCNVCKTSERFWTYQGLARHRQEGHKMVTTPKHAAMKKLFDEINKQCIYCLEPFHVQIDARGFWAHMVIHGITPDSIFRTNKCCACGAIINDRNKMKLHLRTRHALLFAKVAMQNNQMANTATINAMAPKQPHFVERELSCATCTFVTINQELLNKHIATVHSYKCSRCRMRFDEIDTMHQHFATTHSQEKEECPICKVKIKIGRAFVRHMKSEHVKECSVVVPRLRKAVLEERQDELECVLEAIAATKFKSPQNKRKRVAPQRVEKEKLEAPQEKVIVLDADSPPRKKFRSEARCEAIRNGKQVLEVDGEEIVVEINQDDEEEEEDTGLSLKISSSQSLAENKENENEESGLSLKIASTHSLSENVDAQSIASSNREENESPIKISSQSENVSSSERTDEPMNNKDKDQPKDVDRIVITDSSEMNDSREVIALDDSIDVPDDGDPDKNTPVPIEENTKLDDCIHGDKNEMDTS